MPLEIEQPSSSAAVSTPPTSRLPDYHVLGSLTDSKAGTIPLLLRMPDGNCEQLDVPVHSTVDDIASSLQKDSNDVYRLSFGKSDLDPAANLLDTNIVDAYEHAGSLLHLIASGRQDADTKAAALDSACAVVENISNGIKNMEALCAAAMPDTIDQPEQPDSPRQNGQQPSDVERSEYPANSSDATPSQLAYHLSRRLPTLFPPSGTAAAFPQDGTEQPTIGRQVSIQPSLSSIRDARRRASALRKAKENDPASKPPESEPDIAIGESTNAPLNLEQRSDAQPREGMSSLMLANSEKATWLEDVMKTWEVDTVRDSGILEKSKDGQEISSYLRSLQAEAESDFQAEKIDSQQQPSPNSTTSIPGDSSGEEDEYSEQGDTNDKQSCQNVTMPNGQQSPPNDYTKNKQQNATDELQKSIAAVNISGQTRTSPTTHMVIAQNAASAAAMEGATKSGQSTKSIDHLPQKSHPQRHDDQHRKRLERVQEQFQSVPNQAQQKPPDQPEQIIPAKSNGFAPVTSKSPVPSGVSSPSIISKAETSSSSKDTKNKPPVRQATKIAPAPNLTPPPCANGLFTYPGVVSVQSIRYAPKPAPVPPVPKKRGRKRKNPELTDAERELERKNKNRESAKLSRVRRKVIAAEYEGRLNALVDENAMLRKQVEGLNNRLVYLQSLLTISVRQEPPSS